ncbi:cohesin domain-containing protein [Candidatus Parcubacteria bacterium]|nr:cohesin domain-containing protein [Patescibacteria group bacterium]MBU4309456.1 cohesin domain-containing protein [Patescibacteria group bacterium]MBU4432418.1 cohesin domain-containing protein [Patescibacteria group bacterium]MBU4577817.1 cohesin domain-containing protein [Patescibacteria group bacterium]MCG2696810.1 cohesin domain-containing protein [Candidatus Parcubacteria bacterium]
MRRKIINTIFGNIIIASLIFGAVNIFTNSASAAGASLYLTPSTGTYVIDGEFTISVKLNTGGQVVNAAEGALSYDAALLEAVSINRNGAVFNLWTTEPVATGGNIKFGGGVPMPGYNGVSGHVLSVKFKAKAPGVAQVNFTSGAVLANDGKGTNILASMGVGSYTISPKIEAPTSGLEDKTVDSDKALQLINEKVVASGEEYNHPKIESITNPDQNTWSKNPNVKFNWILPAGTKDVAFVLNKEPVWNLAAKSEGALSEKEYVGVEDGLWYFHLRFKDAKKWGTVATYRVMIDTRPPNPLNVKINDIGVGEWPELLFNAADAESGLGDYEIFIGSLEHQSFTLSGQETMLKISALSVGDHTAMVKAKDKAGNEIVSTIKFVINPIESPKILSYQEEMRSANDFYLSGTALPNVGVILYLQRDNELVASSTVRSDANGAWFFVGDKKLANGRYVAWAEAVNANGIKSNPSEKVTFIVSPPIFVTIGNFVINYFTVFTSLLFLIVLIIFLVGKVRGRLKKETVEVENVSRTNLDELEAFIDQEFARLKKFEGKVNYTQEKKKMKDGLRARVGAVEKKILKEVKDVEDILK